jgi:hypothetical protein
MQHQQLNLKQHQRLNLLQQQVNLLQSVQAARLKGK